MSSRYDVIRPDTLEEMRRAGHIAKLEARIEKLELVEKAFEQNQQTWSRNIARIEKLEAALYEIVHINNMRDRFSSEIDNVITTVLGEKK